MSNSEETARESSPENSDSPELRYQNREEYTRELETWVNEARMWQHISSNFPYFLLLNNSLTANTVENDPLINVQDNLRNINDTLQRPNQYRQPEDLVENEAYEFVIPPIWKRVLAEAIDFIILFVLKLALTLVVLEMVDTSEWQFLKEDVSNIADVQLGAEITTGILLLEGIHRVVVCLYEVYFLRGNDEIHFGCATPGKALLGITVILATKMRPSENRNDRPTVLVYPAKNLGLMVAFGRSFVKNCILAVMFPFCFAFFLFQHNRAGYDIICNTIVVEYDANPPKRNFLPA